MGGRAAPTPAAHVIDLRRKIAYLERDLAEAESKLSRTEERLARFTVLSKTSFGGIEMAQSWCEFVLWEGLLNDGDFNAIIELGTWQGGSSHWLFAQTRTRAMIRREAGRASTNFRTYDSVAPNAPVEGFERKDVFAAAEEIIEFIHAYEPVVLFCDNGNKPRELRTFGTALRHPDSRVVVHDWGTEVMPEDVPDSLEMVHREFCEELGSMSRVFKRRDDEG